MKIRIYRNLFSDIYTVHIERFINTFDNIRSVMAFFESDAFVFSVVGADFSSAFYGSLNHSQGCTAILPEKITIVSEALISVEKEVFVPFLQEIFATEPRYITVLGLNGKYDLSERALEYLGNKERYHLLKSGLIDYAVSFVIEECCASIDISSKMIFPKELRDKLKRL